MEQTDLASPDAPRRTLVRGSAAVRDALAPLVDRARHEVALFAPQLPGELFNTVAFARALASFAARHPRNRSRLLLDDVPQARRDNDRVMALARRLSDTVLIHRVADDDRGYRDIILLIDHTACLQQQDFAHTEATIDTRGGAAIAQLIQRFDAMWERSEPISLTPLGL